MNPITTAFAVTLIGSLAASCFAYGARAATRSESTTMTVTATVTSTAGEEAETCVVGVDCMPIVEESDSEAAPKKE